MNTCIEQKVSMVLVGGKKDTNKIINIYLLCLTYRIYNKCTLLDLVLVDLFLIFTFFFFFSELQELLK